MDFTSTFREVIICYQSLYVLEMQYDVIQLNYILLAFIWNIYTYV